MPTKHSHEARTARHGHALERSDGTRSRGRRCDWPGCEGEGEHRAPKSRERLHEYFWFCLDHVRVYNASWNYYAGMTDEQVEADLRRDTCWNRPTWRLGGAGGRLGFRSESVVDDFGLFGEAPPPPARPEQLTPEDQAMVVMDLEAPVTVDGLKARYKELVKRYHPDVTGGDKVSEEKFKQINQAYRTLMASLRSP